jgi:hypothetical protein
MTPVSYYENVVLDFSEGENLVSAGGRATAIYSQPKMLE